MPDYSQTPWNVIPLSAAPTDKVSAHFTLRELLRSDIAARLNIENRFPDVETLRTAVHLCREVLEPLRQAHGPFSPNSVFRR